jgi:hypothetical protein
VYVGSWAWELQLLFPRVTLKQHNNITHPRQMPLPLPPRLNLLIILRTSKAPLHFGEGPWPWQCWEPSKHIQRLSLENIKIIYVWAWVVKCNLKWK